MTPALTLVWMTLAGAAGSAARYWVGVWLKGRRFPWGTLAVNVVGSLLLGLLTAAAVGGLAGVASPFAHPEFIHRLSPQALTILGVGFCGGFTTFSTASQESFQFLQDRDYAGFALWSMGQLAVTVLAAILGFWLGTPT